MKFQIPVRLEYEFLFSSLFLMGLNFLMLPPLWWIFHALIIKLVLSTETGVSKWYIYKSAKNTSRGGRAVLGAISNSSRENALGPRFESRLGHERLYSTVAVIIIILDLSPLKILFYVLTCITFFRYASITCNAFIASYNYMLWDI